MRFEKGKSGNPGGRPALLKEVRALAGEFTEEAVRGLVAIARDETQPAPARVAAWDKILDRAVGKAAQPQTGEGGEGPIRLKIEIIDADAEVEGPPTASPSGSPED